MQTRQIFETTALFAIGFLLQSCLNGADGGDGSPTVISPDGVVDSSTPDGSTRSRDTSPADTGRGGDARDAGGDTGGSSPQLGPVLEGGDTVQLGPGMKLDLFSARLRNGSSGDRLVVGSANGTFKKGGLFGVALPLSNGASLAAMNVSNAALVLNPSSAVSGGETWLYYGHSKSAKSSATWKRAPYQSGSLGTAQRVDLPDTGLSLLAWPRFTTLENGRIAAAYRTTSKMKLAISQNGTNFDTVHVVDPNPGAVPHVAQFGSGELVYTFQRRNSAGAMTSYFRIARNGPSSWSRPTKVTTIGRNVHDTTTVRRPDGHIDLYYSYTGDRRSFTLYRRLLKPDGTLGPEQQVTPHALGSPTKPKVHSQSDGEFLVTWSDITKRGSNGRPSEQVLTAAVLKGAAPASK